MRSICKAVSVIILPIFIFTSEVKSQGKFEGYEIGINAGTLIYQGDVTPQAYGYLKAIKPALGIFISKPFSNYFSVRANLTRGKILADDAAYDEPAYKQFRNFKFSSRVTEVTASVVFSPYSNNTESGFRRFSPYLFAGAGVSFLNIKRDYSNINTTYFSDKSSAIIGLGIDTVHAMPKLLPVIPVGAGIKYAISQNWFINAEGAYRFTTSDYLDGFKHAANPKLKDSYYGASIGISYKILANRFKCPKVL